MLVYCLYNIYIYIIHSANPLPTQGDGVFRECVAILDMVHVVPAGSAKLSGNGLILLKRVLFISINSLIICIHGF